MTDVVEFLLATVPLLPVPACYSVLHLEDITNDASPVITLQTSLSSLTDLVEFVLAAVFFIRKTTMLIPLQSSLSSLNDLVEFLLCPSSGRHH